MWSKNDGFQGVVGYSFVSDESEQRHAAQLRRVVRRRKWGTGPGMRGNVAMIL
jgi:hypothetical protein